MEKALLKRKVVSAESVATLPEHDLSEIRRDFKCIACEADAYFNKGSWRQAPHFAAKNHMEFCLETYYATRTQEKLVEADTLVIPIVGRGPSSADQHVRAIESQLRSRTSLVGAGTGTSNKSATRGVGAVLRELINHPELAVSSKNIVAGKHTALASEFFVPFDQLSDRHVQRPIGVWGTIFSAREGGSIAWLNRGDRKVNIKVPTPIFDNLKVSYRFNNASELRGAKFLLLGTFNIHLECQIDDAMQIAIQITKPLA